LRNFRCKECDETNTLYDWNTNERVFGNLTLHEVKDDIEFVELRKMILFTCPTCKKHQWLMK